MGRRLRVAMAVVSLSLLAGACGGGGDDDQAAPATTVATTTPVATTATTALTSDQPGALARLANVFTPIVGHDYSELSEALIRQLQDEYVSDPKNQVALAALDARTVSRNGNDEIVALVIAARFDGAAASQPGAEARFISGVMNEAGTQKLTLAGEEVTIGTNAEGTRAIAWVESPLGLVFVGTDEATLRVVAASLIDSNS